MDSLNLPNRARLFLTERNFVVLDTETTGLDVYDDRTEIVEVAIADPDGETLLNTLVRPQYPIPAVAMGIHGISDEMVANAPTFLDVLPSIVEATRDKIIIVYNADYDLPLLAALSMRCGMTRIFPGGYCLMKAYAEHRNGPRGRWCSLTKACMQEGVDLRNAHRAMGDVQATLELLKIMARKVE